MSEQQERDFGREPRKPYRRRKKYQGATWTPPSMSAEVGEGLWCKRCKQRHGYKTLGLKYERRGPAGHQHWVIVWNCPKTGNVVGETTLGAKRETGSDAADRTGTGEPGPAG